MALIRFNSLKNLHQKLSFFPNEKTLIYNLQRQNWIAAKSGDGDEKSLEGNKKEIDVSENGNKKQFKLFPWKSHKKGIWKNTNSHFLPPLNGLGHAIMQATENMNKLFENLNIKPWTLTGRVKEKEEYYKLRYAMPGISKQELNITVEDGVLKITGEHKEEKEESTSSSDDNDDWSYAETYGYYNASIILPDDAKIDEIKAELKDGVLDITIPRNEMVKKDVKEIEIN